MIPQLQFGRWKWLLQRSRISVHVTAVSMLREGMAFTAVSLLFKNLKQFNSILLYCNIIEVLCS